MKIAQYLEPWTPRVLSILRIMFGLLILQHAIQKLFGFPVPSPQAAQVMSSLPPIMVMLATAIELVCGTLVTVGLFTRASALLMSGEMAIAYFMVYSPRGLMPIANGGSLAVAYCFVFFYLAFAGAGAWSADALLRRGS
jgi:putative oxidoreductase